MHVSAFYASSVQLGTHPHMWLHCIYTCELALTKSTRYNTTNTCGHAQSVIGHCVIIIVVISLCLCALSTLSCTLSFMILCLILYINARAHARTHTEETVYLLFTINVPLGIWN